MARQGLRTKGGTGIWVWVLVAFGVFLVSAMASVDEPRNLGRADSTETTPERVSQEAHMEVEETEGVIADLRATVARLTAEKTNLAGEHDRQLAEMGVLRGALITAQVSQTGAENALQSELESRRALAVQTRDRMAQMQRDIETLMAQARTLQEQKELVEAANADMITRIHAKDQRILQLEGDQQQIPQLETRIAQYIEQKDNAEAEVRRLGTKTRTLELEVINLRREKETAEDQLTVILGSKKRPLRKNETFKGQLIIHDRSDRRDYEDHGIGRPKYRKAS